MWGTYWRLALPGKHLSIIRRVIRQIIQFWDLAGGNYQAEKDKEN
jgi:hypothetical protein